MILERSLSTMDDAAWPDPTAATDRRRLALRLAVSLLAFIVLAFATRGYLLEAVTMLWPPSDPLSRWVTFLLLQAFGYLLVPLMIGSLVADVVLERL